MKMDFENQMAQKQEEHEKEKSILVAMRDASRETAIQVQTRVIWSDDC